MKFIYTLITTLYLSPTLAAQDISSTTVLYRIALEKYAIQRDSFYEKHQVARSTTIFLEDNGCFKNRPEKLNGRDIVLLTYENKDSVYRSENYHLRYVVAHPIILGDSLHANEIAITLQPYGSRKNRRKKRYDLTVSDWTTVYFKFDCDAKTWRYLRTINNGI